MTFLKICGCPSFVFSQSTYTYVTCCPYCSSGEAIRLTLNTDVSIVMAYPAHGKLQLQLCQPSADTHPLPDAKGNVGKRVDGAILSQPAFRFKLLPVIKVLLIGAQSMAVYH